MSCNDGFEPECDGESCNEWGKCEFSKQVIREETGLDIDDTKAFKQNEDDSND